MTDIEKARPLTPAEVSWKTAQRVAGTPFVPSAFRGKPEAVFAAILFGEELGIGPMQALSSIHVIEGKPGMSPELMRALVARAGHRIDVKEASGTKVVLWGKRCDNDSEATVTWTMEDAKLAGLAGRGAWKTYPRAMLLARATSELCRMVFADVVAGLSYTPEENASVAGVEWDELPVDPLQGAIAPAPAPEPKPLSIDLDIIEDAIIVDPPEVEDDFMPPVREPDLEEIFDAEIVEESPPSSSGIDVISVKQLGKMRALFVEWGVNKADQSDLLSVILGREVPHPSKLTKRDGSKVIDYLINHHPGGTV
jgi:hypothetical protein